MTNMEFIQCASREKLAEYFAHHYNGCPPVNNCKKHESCTECWEEWLMKEKEESSNV